MGAVGSSVLGELNSRPKALVHVTVGRLLTWPYEALDERSLPREIRAPTLVVHGDADEVIPQQVSAHLFDALGSEAKQLWIVDDGDHRLSDVADDIWRRVDALTESESA